MKLYAIVDTNNIPIAISEDDSTLYNFYYQNNLSYDKYKIVTIKDRQTSNNILVLYEDTYIMEFYNYYIRECDKTKIESIIFDTVVLLHNTVNLLNNINDYLIIDNIKDINKCNKISNMIYKYTHNNLNVKKIIDDYYKSINLRSDKRFLDIPISGGNNK